MNDDQKQLNISGSQSGSPLSLDFEKRKECTDEQTSYDRNSERGGTNVQTMEIPQINLETIDVSATDTENTQAQYGDFGHDVDTVFKMQEFVELKSSEQKEAAALSGSAKNTFTGILLDVSCSMGSSIGDGKDEGGGTWASFIFTVIDDLVKHDDSRDNRVFAVGVGATKGEEIFDIIGTIKMMQGNADIQGSTDISLVSYQTMEDIFSLLERSGTKTIRKWARQDVIITAVSEFEAKLILEKLKSDSEFTRTFVYEFLPASCRDWNIAVPFGGFLQGVISSAVSSFRQASVKEIKEVARRSMDFIKRSLTVKALDDQSVYSAQDAGNVIHRYANERDLTTKRTRELLEIVEPCTYGRTPLYLALEKASNLFLRSVYSYPNHNRLLFILSDGMATDYGHLTDIRSQLEDLDVTIVGCYITRSPKVEQKTLHNVEEFDWETGAKFLFKLSSTVPTELVIRAIFMKQGWQFDFTNNETKLFIHVNHPDHLEEVCNLARNVVSSQDSLSALLTSVSLDIYINRKNTTFKAHTQVGGTSYANASAAVLYLAMHRILGRDGGYPEFEVLRDDLINSYGSEGANTFQVLREICPVYRLHCREVDVSGAMEAIAAKRPVVARFRLTNEEWDKFTRFYGNNPTGIMKKENLDISMRSRFARTDGHAVVLTSYNSECLRLMNSWGEEWADNGFFRVENADVLGLEFIDVFWTSKDLSKREKDYYRKYGSEVADKLIRSIKGLQVAEFTCPLCQSKSKVTEFSGTLSRACCPMCHGTFSSYDGEGNILALNIYLTSLSR